MPSLEVLLAVVAGVVLLAVLAVRLSVRLGLPSLLIYLGMGVLLGESVLGIQFSDTPLTESLALAALVLILIEGGLTTSWPSVRPSLGVGVAMATGAVAVSIGVAGVALHLALGLEWRTAFLWGAVLSSTDAAAVFSVLRGVGVGRRLAGVLELESGLNDAPVVLAVILLSSPEPLTWQAPLLVVYELAVGAALGWLFGRGGAAALRRAALPATGLYPLAAMAVCVLVYAAGQFAHASGLLATYVAALVLGNSALPHRGGVRSFAEGTGLLAQIGLFVLLGLYASPARLPDAVIPALIAGVVSAGRPAAVGAGRGHAVPGAMARAGVPVLGGPARRGADRARADRPDRGRAWRAALVRRGVRAGRGAHAGAGHHPALGGPAARRGPGAEPREIEVDAAPLDELGADLLQVRVPVGSKLHGVYLGELRLPRGATVSLVVRAGEAFTPTGRPACASATSCWWWPPRRPRRDRGPAARGGRGARRRLATGGPGSGPGAVRDRASSWTRSERPDRVPPTR